MKCIECGNEYAIDENISECLHCGNILQFVFNYEELQNKISKKELDKRIFPLGVWKYQEFLPINFYPDPISLGEGGTFLHESLNLAKELGIDLYLKDETRNPTGSFLDRGTTVIMTKLQRLGIENVRCVSIGNFGVSVAAYAAKAGIHCEILLPRDGIDIGKLHQMIIYGADFVPETREISEIEKRAEKLTDEFFYLKPTNPYFLEGIKTIAFEIIEQLNWYTPDRVIVPMGKGSLLSMIWKGFKEFYKLGLINSLPKMTGIQSEGCSPIVNAFKRGKKHATSIKTVKTIIADLSFVNPSDGFRAIQAIQESGGVAEAASDKEILEAESLLAKSEGIFAEPAAATTIAGLKRLIDDGHIDKNEKIICVITGLGLKSPEAVKDMLSKIEKAERLIREPEGRMIVKRIGDTKLRILEILSEETSYGYEIWKELEHRFGKTIKVPTVYQHLSELAKLSLVKESDLEKANGSERKYYMLTEKGKKVLEMLKKLF